MKLYSLSNFADVADDVSSRSSQALANDTGGPQERNRVPKTTCQLGARGSPGAASGEPAQLARLGGSGSGADCKQAAGSTLSRSQAPPADTHRLAVVLLPPGWHSGWRNADVPLQRANKVARERIRQKQHFYSGALL